jgi:threonine synthase
LHYNRNGESPHYLFSFFKEGEGMENLECIFCQREYPLDIFNPFCPECHEPLLCPSSQKKRKFFLEKTSPLEKFLDFLPLSKIDPNLSLGEGNTPLLKLNRVMENFSLPPVFLKNETVNPIACFKDRGTAVAVQKAVSLGIERIGTVSTGNMASSTAAYGAKAGLETFVLLKEDISADKLLMTSMYNPVLVKVKGDYGELFYKSFSLGEKHNIYFMNSVDPFRIEGYKVTSFEIFLQLESRVPRYLFTPMSSGAHLIGLMKAFLDLKKEGFIQRLPILVGVQAHGCSPIAQAYASGKSKVKRIRKGETIAQSISNPDPPGGNIVLKLIRENSGIVLDVSDKEILEAQKILAELEGIFCEPASATSLAGLLKLSGKMKLRPYDRMVLAVTGSGLKAMNVLEPSGINVHEATISSLERKISSILE